MSNTRTRATCTFKKKSASESTTSSVAGSGSLNSESGSGSDNNNININQQVTVAPSTSSSTMVRNESDNIKVESNPRFVADQARMIGVWESMGFRRIKNTHYWGRNEALIAPDVQSFCPKIVAAFGGKEPFVEVLLIADEEEEESDVEEEEMDAESDGISASGEGEFPVMLDSEEEVY